MRAAEMAEHCRHAVEVATASVGAAPGLAWGAGVALAASGLGLAGWRLGWWRKAAFALVPLWSRLTPAEIVRHPARARVLATVRARPGIPTAELVAVTGLNEGTLLYHAERLERGRFLKSLRVGRDRLWFEAGGPATPDVAALSVPTRRALLAAVEEDPGRAKADYAARLGLAKATVHEHLAVLAQAGLVEFRRDGLRVACWPRPRPS